MLSSRDEMIGEHIQCPMCEVDLEVPPPIRRVPTPAQTPAAATNDEENVAEERPIKFRRSDTTAEEAEVDMTPMVDVTFLLLIFFMVTASFALQKSFEIPAPQEKQEQARSVQQLEQDPDVVVVRIDSYNTFYLSGATWDEEQEAPTKQDLLAKLREARRGDRGAVPTHMLVMAHGDAQHEKVVDALDAGTSVGMEDVKLVTVEDDEI
jgi:biopolymer transport protein ExbD